MQLSYDFDWFFFSFKSEQSDDQSKRIQQFKISREILLVLLDSKNETFFEKAILSFPKFKYYGKEQYLLLVEKIQIIRGVHMNMKKILPAIALVSCFMLTGCKAKSIELSVSPDQVMNPYQTIIVDVKTSPFPTRIDPNSITVNGGESWVEDGVIKFEAEDPGDYTVRVDQDGVTSNTVTISIVPKGSNPVADNNSGASDSSSDSSSQVTDSKEAVEKEFKDQTISVDAAYENADKLIQYQVPVVVTGNLPQALVADKNGQMVPVLWNSTTSEYIILQGFEIPFGGCTAQATGTLSRDASGQLVMTMTFIRTDEEPQVRHDTSSEEDKDSDSDKKDDQTQDTNPQTQDPNQNSQGSVNQ